MHKKKVWLMEKKKISSLRLKSKKKNENNNNKSEKEKRKRVGSLRLFEKEQVGKDA